MERQEHQEGASGSFEEVRRLSMSCQDLKQEVNRQNASVCMLRGSRGSQGMPEPDPKPPFLFSGEQTYQPHAGVSKEAW